MMAINPQRPVPSVLLNVAEGIYPNRFGYIFYPPSKTEQKMNERIRELVRQAGLDDADFPIENWDNVPLAKFAELIVRECILTIQMGITRDGHNTEKYLRSMKHIKQIKEHFGVE